MKFANFGFSGISHWPEVEDVKHVDEIFIVDTPICEKEMPPELEANLKCHLEVNFDVDERCKEVLKSSLAIADYRAYCDNLNAPDFFPRLTNRTSYPFSPFK